MIRMTQSGTSAADMRDMPGACPYCSTPTCATYHHGPCPERNRLKLDINLRVEGSQYLSKDFEEKVRRIITKEVRRAI